MGFSDGKDKLFRAYKLGDPYDWSYLTDVKNIKKIRGNLELGVSIPYSSGITT